MGVSSDFNGDLLTKCFCGFQLVEQALVGLPRVVQPVLTNTYADENAAFCILVCVAWVDADAFESVNINQQRHWLLEPIAVGDDDLVRAAWDCSLAIDLFSAVLKMTITVFEGVALLQAIDVERTDTALVAEDLTVKKEFHFG